MADPTDTVKRRRCEVVLSRLVREEQVVVVEMDNIQTVLDQTKQIYQAAEGNPYDAQWEADTEWGCEEGSHRVRAIRSDKERYDDDCDFTVTENGVSRWSRPAVDLEEVIASAIADPAVTKRLSNLGDSKFTARFVVQDGQVRVRVEDFEDLDG